MPAERTASALSLLALLTGASACSPSVEPAAPTSSAPTAQHASVEPERSSASENPWQACYSSFTPSGDASSDLSRLTRDCGATGGMRPITSVRVGEQTESDPVDPYTFEVPASGKCYRVYGVGDGGIQDLDLLLRAPSGEPIAADVTHDSWPVLPPGEPACFTEPGAYRLEVSVYRGSGHYALQVWGR